MSLSAETLKERYGHLQPFEKVKQMIEDMVDTSVIMQAVRTYGAKCYEAGVRDGESRYQSRHHDMGQ